MRGTVAPFSGDRDIDGILIGSKWTGTDLTFSFPTRGSLYGRASSYPDDLNDDLVPFNAAQQNAARYALGLVESYTNLTFTEIAETSSSHARLRFAQTEDPDVESAQGLFPANREDAGDVWFGRTGQPYYEDPAKGNWGMATQMHEIGHALGLKHGQDDYRREDLRFYLDPLGEEPRAGSAPLPAAHDGQAWSVMTYRSAPGQPVVFEGDGFNQPQTFMQNDIAALQFLYGADFGHNADDTVYWWSPQSGRMSVDGVAQDAPTANKIFMTVWDGNGNDTYDLASYATDLVIDLAPGAFSTFSRAQLVDNRPLSEVDVLAPGNIANARLFEGDRRSLIENAIGGRGDDRLRGNVADNRLVGNAGNDTLSGGAGGDTLVSGLGHDEVVGGSGSDLLVVNYAAVRAGVGYASTSGWSVLFTTTPSFVQTNSVRYSGIERLDVTGSRTHHNDLRGNAGDDMLRGGDAGNDIRGGAGNDRLVGGRGADRLDPGAGRDTVIGGAGHDTLAADFSGFSRDLVLDNDPAAVRGLANGVRVTGVEALVLETGAGDDVIRNTRIRADDSLAAGGGDDTLASGLGHDTVDGGRGSDLLVVNYAGETAGMAYATSGGWSIVTTTESYANTNSVTYRGIERLDITGSRTDFNEIRGNAGADRLRGGEAGNDIRGGAGGDRLTGGAGADRLAGDAGDDVLAGRRGADVLTGGRGADVFLFDTTPGAGVDRITDFEAADTIHLENAVFRGLAAGTLSAAAFFVGPAHDRDDRILYDRDTGDLLFDRDGDRSGAAIVFATLSPGLTLTADDFFVM